MEMTKAEELFEAYHVYKNAEEGSLWDFLESTFGVNTIDNYGFDPYDYSLELYHTEPSWAPVQDQLDKLAEYGFRVFYVNYKDKTARRYGALPKDDNGRCTWNRGPNND